MQMMAHSESAFCINYPSTSEHVNLSTISPQFKQEDSKQHVHGRHTMALDAGWPNT